MSSRPDVVVIGGGAIGCAVAWRLAQRGWPVTLLERAEPGRGATWAAAGMLSPVSEVHDPAFLELAEASFALYPAFIDELRVAAGVDVEFGTPGKLSFAYTPDDVGHLRIKSPDVISALDAGRLEAEVTTDVVGAVLFPRDGFVDNRTMGVALARAAERAGARMWTGQSVQSIESAGGSVQAVVLESGERIACETVVLAGGAWSSSIRGLPRRLRVLPVKGQMVALRTNVQLRHMLQSPDCYLIPRSGQRVLVGATVEHVGFDARTTLAGVQALLTAARRLVPRLADAEIIETWTGFRPGTPDDLPILGPEPELSGLVYATGHYRNGILLTPLTAQLVSALITEPSASLPLHDFRADRFADERATNRAVT